MPRIHSGLYDGRKDGREISRRVERGHSGHPGSIDDGVAIIVEDGAFDGGAVGGRSDDNGLKMRLDFSGEFGGRAHKTDDCVVVGDEGGQQPGANVASDAEQEDLHFD